MRPHQEPLARKASWLISAATRRELLDKANTSKADVAIFDFEDGLSADQKTAGRAVFREAFLARGPVRPSIAVRINSLATRLGIEDLLFLLERDVIPEIVILARSGSLRDITIVSEVLGGARPDLRIFSVVESLEGFRALREISHAPPLLGGIHFGAADLAADIGLRLSRVNLDFYRSEIVFAARSNGIAAVDSPCFQIDNEAILRAECESAVRLGFDGKIALHPRQVPIINEYFKTSNDDIAYARDIVARHTKQTITQVEGEVTGPPFVRYAKKLLRRADVEAKTEEP
jgi:citrate lyase beta subunit